MRFIAALLFAGFGISGSISAQPGTGMPPVPTPGGPSVPGYVCTAIEGDLEITSETVDTIEGVVTGDVEGDWSATVTDTLELGGGIIVVTSFDAVLTTADGDIQTSGYLARLSLDPVGMLSITMSRQLITGGTGAYEGAIGHLAVVQFDLPSFSYSSLGGIVCIPENDTNE